MTITLSPEVESLITEQVAVGRFASADEAIRAAVMQLAASTAVGDDELAELRAVIDVGLAEADRGEFVEFTAEDVIAEQRSAYARRRQAAGHH